MLRIQSEIPNNQIKSIFGDKNALESIEFTLKKYENFIDLLKKSGYEKLIEASNSTPKTSLLSSQREIEEIFSNQIKSPEQIIEDKFPSKKSKKSKQTLSINNDELAEFNIKSRAYLNATSYDQIGNIIK